MHCLSSSMPGSTFKSAVCVVDAGYTLQGFFWSFFETQIAKSIFSRVNSYLGFKNISLSSGCPNHCQQILRKPKKVREKYNC